LDTGDHFAGQWALSPSDAPVNRLAGSATGDVNLSSDAAWPGEDGALAPPAAGPRREAARLIPNGLTPQCTKWPIAERTVRPGV